jgi:hypothetical protein
MRRHLADLCAFADDCTRVSDDQRDTLGNQA